MIPTTDFDLLSLIVIFCHIEAVLRIMMVALIPCVWASSETGAGAAAPVASGTADVGNACDAVCGICAPRMQMAAHKDNYQWVESIIEVSE